MPIKELKQKYLKRFNELIDAGESLRSTEFIPENGIESLVDLEKFNTWKVRCVTLLESLIPKSSENYKHVENLRKMRNTYKQFIYGIGTLKGIKDDYEGDFLDSWANKIETAIAYDYMRQAQKLIEGGSDGKFDHVPAAVLSGAVLEKSLRSLCERQSPAIPTLKPNGEPFAMTNLIDTLKAASLYNETRAKELRSYADIRNHAAHGRVTEFDKEQVKRMIDGITSFIANYM